jgi:hypothetical protein
MKTHIVIFGLLVASGCAIDDEELTAREQAAIGCPDPDRCGLSNGNGIYGEELADIGVGPNEFMFTRFVNVAGGGVTIRGRYKASAVQWLFSTGAVYYANYNGQTHLTVLSVEETGTVPKWQLFDGSNTITVTGDQIADMQLVVTLDDGTLNELYTLKFENYGSETLTQLVNMRWKLTTGTTWNQYCHRTDGTNDEVVFQQGIAVDPVDASVNRTPAAVTLSCRRGAMATVRLWGYSYRGSNVTLTNLFDAGLHMKRASYCGDASFYTRANTEILVWDNQGIQNAWQPSATRSASCSARAAWAPCTGRATGGSIGRSRSSSSSVRTPT